MKIKDKLLQESKKINIDVSPLDEVFSNIDLAEDVKAKFESAYSAAATSEAIKLAEGHVNELVEKAEQYMEEAKVEIAEDQTKKIGEYMKYVTEEWLSENKLAVDNGIKVQMFDGLVESLKGLFEDHNIEIPSDKVDVVSELEENLSDTQKSLDEFVSKASDLENKIEEMEKGSLVAKRTKNLTESQVERVSDLVEGLKFDDTFENKLSNIVEMVKGDSDEDEDEDEDEDKPKKEKYKSKSKKEDKDEDLDETGLNYGSEDKNLDESEEDPELSQYTKVFG